METGNDQQPSTPKGFSKIDLRPIALGPLQKYRHPNMEGTNLMCDTQCCGNPAVAFGVKETYKIKCCEVHIASLLSKRMQICDIMGYSFIDNLHDAAVFEERKTLTEKSRGNLMVLELNCDSELADALKTIDTVKASVIASVEQRFEEMKVAVTEACNEAKKQFAELQRNLDQFLVSKDNQLSQTAELMSATLGMVPKFLRFGVSDASDLISAVLDDSWVVATADIASSLKCLDAGQKKAVISSALAEASNYAKKGIEEALLYANLLIGEEESYEQDKFQVITELLKYEEKQLRGNLKWLQRSWDLRQRCGLSDRVTMKIGQQLGVLLCNELGQVSAAEQILRQCFDTVQAQSTASEDAMLLCRDICSVYFASAQHDQLQQLGEWALQTYADLGFPAEYYWTILLYVINSKFEKEKKSEASTILEDWRKRDLRDVTKLCEMLRRYIDGMEVYYNGNKEEAEKFFLQARRIGISSYPTSFFTADVLAWLAILCNDSTREEFHRQAHSIFNVISSISIHTAINLNNTGTMLKDREKLDEAEECYRQAWHILEIVAPQSLSAGLNRNSMGGIYQQKNQWAEAEECYVKARSILNVAAAKSISEAANLRDMGLFMKERGRLNEAEECYREAQSICDIIAQQSNTAANIQNYMGDLFIMKKQWAQAEECFRRAQDILDIVAPNSASMAGNLRDLGQLMKGRERWDEAEEFFRKAQSIFEVAAPQSITAGYNLSNLGDLYQAKEQLNKAEECYQKAQQIFEAVAPKSVNAALNYNGLGLLMKKSGKWNEAEDCFRKAHAIFEITTPNSMNTAVILQNLAILLKERERLNDSEKYYRQAQSIIDVIAPRSISAACNLFDLGRLFEKMEQWSKVEECFQQALSIYKVTASNSHTEAVNLNSMGITFYNRDHYREAEACYQLAQSIFLATAPKSASAAANLFNLGLLYKAVGKTAQALEYFQKAAPVYASCGNESMKSKAEEYITQLKKSTK